ncbi:MAG: putative toxin-antitoxin system toxin component, PIN family [Fibrobacterota bacterium]
MTAVFDTNVFVSALLFGGRPREALEKAIDGTVRLFISKAIVNELHGTLFKPKFKLTQEQAAMFIEEVEALCHPVFPREKVIRECRDRKDHIVLECALESRSGMIVTGDDDLLVLKNFRGIPIISVAEFLYRLQA